MQSNSRHPLRLLSAYTSTQISSGCPATSSSFLAASSSSLNQSIFLSQAFSSTTKPVDQSASVLSAEEAFDNAAEAAESEATSATRGPRNLWVDAAKVLIGSVILGAAGGVAYVSYAIDNAAVAKWVKERRASLAVDGSAGQQWWTPMYSKAASAALDVAEKYVEVRSDCEEKLHEFTQPQSDRLLPDLPPQEAQVYTLVVDLEGTLVNSQWKRDRGWRTFKRPGVEAFLERMAQFYEVVLFTDQLNFAADQIVDRLDKKGCIRYRLYRDGTLYSKGNYVKDLTKLNRDPHKVLYLSTRPESVLQSENLVPLPAWEATESDSPAPIDTALLDLLPFLECVARQRPADARAVLASYHDHDIPTEFKERAKKARQQQEERKQHSIFRFARS